MRKIARLQNLGASKYDDPTTFVFMNPKDDKIAQFDPNGLAAPGALYGLPFDEADAEVDRRGIGAEEMRRQDRAAAAAEDEP